MSNAIQTKPCDYCHSDIRVDASRCPICAGEMRYCPRCNQYVGLNQRQKFVGLFRGGMKTQSTCKRCGKILDGPRF